MKRRVIFATLFAWVFVSGNAQQVSGNGQQISGSPQQNPPAIGNAPGIPNGLAFGSTMLGPGDLVQVRVFRTPDLDTQARIDNEGMLSMPLIGPTHLAGLNPDQAGQAIREAYSKKDYIQDPGVTVLVLENASQRASVLGEVRNPGSIPLSPHMRLLDAISAAGGLLNTSAGVVSISHRNDPAPAKTYRISGTLAGSENPEIQAGDTIQAEKAGIVYVVGAVNRAGGFVMENGKSITVLQALSLASGATTFAKLKSACLIRTVDGNKTMIPVNVKALLSDGTKDQPMTPDDILFIPNNNFREGMRTYTQAAVSGAIGLAIYHI